MGVEITWHGLFTALGVIIGVAVATAFARRAGIRKTLYTTSRLPGHRRYHRGARPVRNRKPRRLRGRSARYHPRQHRRHLYLRSAHWWHHRWLALRLLSQGAEHSPRRGHRRDGRHSRMAVGRIGDVINGEHFASDTELPGESVATLRQPKRDRAGPAASASGRRLRNDRRRRDFRHPALHLPPRQPPRRTFFAWVFLYGLLRTLVSFLSAWTISSSSVCGRRSSSASQEW